MAVILCENKIIYYNRHLQLFFSMNKSLNTAKDRKILPLLYIKCDKNPLLDPRDEVGTGGGLLVTDTRRSDRLYLTEIIN